LIQMNRNI